MRPLMPMSGRFESGARAPQVAVELDPDDEGLDAQGLRPEAGVGVESPHPVWVEVVDGRRARVPLTSVTEPDFGLGADVAHVVGAVAVYRDEPDRVDLTWTGGEWSHAGQTAAAPSR